MYWIGWSHLIICDKKFQQALNPGKFCFPMITRNRPQRIVLSEVYWRFKKGAVDSESNPEFVLPAMCVANMSHKQVVGPSTRSWTALVLVDSQLGGSYRQHGRGEVSWVWGKQGGGLPGQWKVGRVGWGQKGSIEGKRVGKEEGRTIAVWLFWIESLCVRPRILTWRLLILWQPWFFCRIEKLYCGAPSLICGKETKVFFT